MPLGGPYLSDTQLAEVAGWNLYRRRGPAGPAGRRGWRRWAGIYICATVPRQRQADAIPGAGVGLGAQPPLDGIESGAAVAWRHPPAARARIERLDSPGARSGHARAGRTDSGGLADTSPAARARIGASMA